MDDAETEYATTQTELLIMLQWGRVMDDAETGGGGQGNLSNPKLQWGRVMDDAETHEIVDDGQSAI